MNNEIIANINIILSILLLIVSITAIIYYICVIKNRQNNRTLSSDQGVSGIIGADQYHPAVRIPPPHPPIPSNELQGLQGDDAEYFHSMGWTGVNFENTKKSFENKKNIKKKEVEKKEMEKEMYRFNKFRYISK